VDIDVLLFRIILAACSLPAHPDELNLCALVRRVISGLKFCMQILLIIYKNNLRDGLGKIDIKHKYADVVE